MLAKADIIGPPLKSPFVNGEASASTFLLSAIKRELHSSVKHLIEVLIFHHLSLAQTISN